MKIQKKKTKLHLSPAQFRVEKANNYLYEELGISIRIDLEGNSLRIRKTLPPRPGSRRTRQHQQTLILELDASQKGIEQAIKDVIELHNLLSLRIFDWRTWDRYIRRSHKRCVRQNELIEAQVERFKNHFPRPSKSRITREEAWKTQWAPYFNKLPSDKHLTDQVILDAIGKKTEEASAGRQRFCIKLVKFIEFLDFETGLDLKKLGEGYELPPITGDELPMDEGILAALDLIDEPEWRVAYLLQAIFGLRNHEIFFLDRSKIESYKGITVLRVPEETKTGFHPVAALYPEWFDEPEWHLRTAKLPEIELDLKKTTLAKIGKEVTDAFKRFGIPFTPYKLRHAWARRAMEFGFTDETSAEFMGHDVQTHRKHYHRLIAMKHGLRIAQSFINNPNRPKPPQRKREVTP